jgi:hypothetical protein
LPRMWRNQHGNSSAGVRGIRERKTVADRREAWGWTHEDGVVDVGSVNLPAGWLGNGWWLWWGGGVNDCWLGIVTGCVEGCINCIRHHLDRRRDCDWKARRIRGRGVRVSPCVERCSHVERGHRRILSIHAFQESGKSSHIKDIRRDLNPCTIRYRSLITTLIAIDRTVAFLTCSRVPSGHRCTVPPKQGPRLKRRRAPEQW